MTVAMVEIGEVRMTVHKGAVLMSVPMIGGGEKLRMNMLMVPISMMVPMLMLGCQVFMLVIMLILKQKP